MPRPAADPELPLHPQIFDLAGQFISGGPAGAFSRDGEEPRLTSADDAARAVDDLLPSLDGCATVGILAPTLDAARALHEKLRTPGMALVTDPDAMLRDGVSVLPAALVQGAGVRRRDRRARRDSGPQAFLFVRDPGAAPPYSSS
jgi:hypothetical protein